MAFGLVAYPLSQPYRLRFERETGGVEKYLLLGELRRMPILKMVRKLREIRDERLFLPVEDKGSEALLPTLLLVGAFTRVKKIIVVGADGRYYPVPRWRVVPAVAGLVQASMASHMASLTCGWELEMLEKTERIGIKNAGEKRLAYLRTDLWFGIKAGGSVGHMAGVINGFVRQGYDVHVLSLAQLEMLDPTVVLHTLAGPSRLGLPFELNNYRFHRVFVRKASRLLAEFQPAFLYHRMSVANYAGVVLSRLLQVPLVVEYNGSEAWVAKHWGTPLRYHGLAVSAEDVMLRHAHLVVTVSDVLRGELLDRGLSGDRIVVYPNCIDPRMFDPQRFSIEENLALRRSLDIQENNTVVGFIGTFGKWHGAEVLARVIWRMVDEQREWITGRRLQFLFVGDGLQMPRVREILAPNQVARFVRFTGLIPQAEAPRYLAACNVLVSPHVPNEDGSRFFGSPTKLFEYMAMAKGIVASDLEQIGQVLRNSLRVRDLPLVGEPTGREMAVLVRPDDEKELIAGIRFLVERPDWCRHLGANARREVLARYTWDHHVGAIVEGLRAVVGLRE